MGALLAIAAHASSAGLSGGCVTRHYPSGWIGLGLLQCSDPVSRILGETMIALVSHVVVAGAAAGFGGPARRVLEARPILYLGRISYGLYVYHPLIPGVFGPLLGVLGLALAPKGVAEFLVYSTLTIIVAGASWRLIEHPINRQKHRFADAR
jgi:peptidoglycan/LPS O-acetylase OafA/YrhL